MFETLWSAQTRNCFYYARYLLTSSLPIVFDAGRKSKLYLLYEGRVKLQGSPDHGRVMGSEASPHPTGAHTFHLYGAV